jgi:hypothetical protein
MADQDDYRIISRDIGPDHRVIAVVKAGSEDNASDDAILDALQQRTSRHLHAVEDPEAE